MTTVETSIPEIQRLEKPALVGGLVALAVCALLGFQNPTQFFRSYLLGFVFWMGLPLGCMAILMIHYMIGGKWGFPLRRPLECGMKTLPVMAVLIIPILLRLPALYSWADAAKVQADAMLQYKHPYLNVPFFIARTVIYFCIWLGISYRLISLSRLQDETGDPTLTNRIQGVCGPSLLLFGLTVTFASIDWVMSLEPAWYSTIFGMIFMVSEALAAMSTVVVVVIFLARRESFAGLISRQVLNDYGNLLLTFTMLWAYLSFSQFLIIWAGNLRDEIPWYMTRARGSWAIVALLLIVFHFAAPFLLLLTRFVKRRADTLRWLATGLLVMSIVDIYWLTVPAYQPAGPQFHLSDFLAIVGIGGLWLWRFTSQLKGRPLLPMNDPRLKEILQHAHA